MKSSKRMDAATLTDGTVGKDRELDLESQLQERVKELHCLAEFGRLVDQESTIEGLLTAAVKLLPPAWQFPDDAVARIRLHDQVFETAALEGCAWVLRGELRRGTALGSVEVGYRVEHPFLLEEDQLLEMVCERLEHVVQRFETEHALRLSERRYRLLADNIMDVIWAVNSDLEFTYVNAAVTALTGFTPEEFIGSRAQDHCDDATISGLLHLRGYHRSQKDRTGPQDHGKPATPGSEARSGGTAGRRGGPRLQQHAECHHGQRGAGPSVGATHPSSFSGPQ